MEKYCPYCLNPIVENVHTCPFCGRDVRYKAQFYQLPDGSMLKGRYFIGAVLGQGGFGITYIGLDVVLKRRVAVKEYYPKDFVNRYSADSTQVSASTNPSDETFFLKGKQRFLEEARILAAFSGVNGVVDVLDCFEENNTVYIVMEFLEGISLKQYLDRNGKLSMDTAMDLLMPVMDALRNIHRKALIHRDISPDNIMLTEQDHRQQVKLIDFGAARQFSSENGKSLTVMLKPGFAPIEQYGMRDDQGAWTDVYALCATIYKCITGVTPESAPDRMREDTLRLPSSLGAAIDPHREQVLMKGLRLSAAERYPNVDALLWDLVSSPAEEPEAFTTEEPVSEMALQSDPDIAPGSVSDGVTMPLDAHRTKMDKADGTTVPLGARQAAPFTPDVETVLLEASRTGQVASGGAQSLEQKDSREQNSEEPTRKKNRNRILAAVCVFTAVCAVVLCVVQILPKLTHNKETSQGADDRNDGVVGDVVNKGADSLSGDNDPLVVGYSNFSGNFSPFFSETAYDQDVWTMTTVSLLGVDRLGAVVEKGISVEPIPYNGTDYTYPGMSDLTITTNEDGTVYYDFVLRDGVTFSDGELLTVDDVIFSMYVLSDPTYDGSSTFFSLPIEGMEAYRRGMDTLSNLIFNAGRENTDFTLFTKDQMNEYWTKYTAATAALVNDIVSFCQENGYAKDLAGAASVWGFDGATDESSFAALLSEAYGADLAKMVNTEAASINLDDYFPNFGDYSGTGIKTGDSAANITGIRKTGDNSLRVVLTEVSAPAIYQLGVAIAPLHYYGDPALYDYDNNSFGFPKGDLSSVRAKTTQPLGAGPYVFDKYENGVVYFTANENYYLGAPKTKNLQFSTAGAADNLNGVITGTVDVTDPSFSKDTAKAISEANSNGEITGDKIMTITCDNLGYGYLGISAKAVNVGGDIGSDASKNLRRAFATVFSVFRDVSVDSYYGEAASVINYPISNTSWAAPRKNDAGYRVAFSKDVNGNDIYTSDMDADAKAVAALRGALGFFEAAGYTVKDGKVTAAPKGARLEYEVWIPADGCGDHPSFMMVNLASDALKTIGITLNVKDLSNSADLWKGLDAGLVPMWCAAWGATSDPDMYQLYYAGVAGDAEPGGSNYMYDIADADLDFLILEARASFDQSYRKQLYKAALDIIVDWAVEIPVYQRQYAIVFSAERIDIDTILPDVTTWYGWLNGIHNIALR